MQSNITLVEITRGAWEIYINQSGESHYIGTFEGTTPLSLIGYEIGEAQIKLNKQEEK